MQTVSQFSDLKFIMKNAPEIKKKVCHMSSAHPPDVRIYNRECVTLQKAGYEVILIAQHNVLEILNGVRIIPIPAAKNRIERVTRIAWSVYRIALFEDADIYHFHDPELIPYGLLLKLKGKKVIYDAHEDVPRQILSKRWIPFRQIVSKVIERIEDFSARRFDAVITATPNICKRFEKNTKVAVDVNNYPILQQIDNDWDQKENAVCYVGSIAEIRGIYEMIQAVNQTKSKLLLAGWFSNEDLKKKAMCVDERNMVEYLGIIKHDEISNVLSRSKAGLVLFHPEPNHVNAQPNKFFEYMSAGIPVIASDFPLWREIIGKTNCGLLVDPLNPLHIAEAITWIFEHPKEAHQMGLNGQKFVREKYSWDIESKKLLNLYNKLLL